jgi:hypothetical protein
MSCVVPRLGDINIHYHRSKYKTMICLKDQLFIIVTI